MMMMEYEQESRTIEENAVKVECKRGGYREAGKSK
jgi:hypothetical protein